MLIRFAVENYNSFKDQQIFSMVAGKQTRHATHYFAVNGKRLLKSSFFFGANASGKSNFVRALDFMRRMTLLGMEVLLKDEEHFYYIISKVENGDYLDNETVKKRTGLPYNDKTLKSALYVFNSEKERESILVADTAKADYWAGKFLEIEEENQDEVCTQKIYTAIEGMIKRETIGASEKENRSYVDYYNLRNNLIVYFKQPREFDFDEMMNCVFGKYEPEHPRLINMNKLKDKVQEKLLSSKYDTAFTIAPQAVKKNMKHIFKVNSCVEMNVVSGAENMRNLIEAFMQDEAAYLKIKVEEDETFKAFFHNKKK